MRAPQPRHQSFLRHVRSRYRRLTAGPSEAKSTKVRARELSIAPSPQAEIKVAPRANPQPAAQNVPPSPSHLAHEERHANGHPESHHYHHHYHHHYFSGWPLAW